MAQGLVLLGWRTEHERHDAILEPERRRPRLFEALDQAQVLDQRDEVVAAQDHRRDVFRRIIDLLHLTRVRAAERADRAAPLGENPDHRLIRLRHRQRDCNAYGCDEGERGRRQDGVAHWRTKDEARNLTKLLEVEPPVLPIAATFSRFYVRDLFDHEEA